MEGNSFNLNRNVAYANGIRPGDNFLVKISGFEKKATIIWRENNTNKTIDVGRLSSILIELNFKEGNEIYLFPTKYELLIKKICNRSKFERGMTFRHKNLDISRKTRVSRDRLHPKNSSN